MSDKGKATYLQRLTHQAFRDFIREEFEITRESTTWMYGPNGKVYRCFLTSVHHDGKVWLNADDTEALQRVGGSWVVGLLNSPKNAYYVVDALKLDHLRSRGNSFGSFRDVLKVDMYKYGREVKVKM